MNEIDTVISGVGSYLPERILTNAELAKTVDTSDEWIRSRTGIGQRHLAADDQATSEPRAGGCLGRACGCGS